eukprot:g19294.t1
MPWQGGIADSCLLRCLLDYLLQPKPGFAAHVQKRSHREKELAQKANYLLHDNKSYNYDVCLHLRVGRIDLPDFRGGDEVKVIVFLHSLVADDMTFGKMREKHPGSFRLVQHDVSIRVLNQNPFRAQKDGYYGKAEPSSVTSTAERLGSKGRGSVNVTVTGGEGQEAGGLGKLYDLWLELAFMTTQCATFTAWYSGFNRISLAANFFPDVRVWQLPFPKEKHHAAKSCLNSPKFRWK